MLLSILLAVSRPAGASEWEIVKEPVQIEMPDHLCFTDPLTGYGVGAEGLVKKTEDGGVTWTVLREADGSGIDWKRIAFSGDSVAYCIADSGYIYKSTDACRHWDMVGDTSVSKVSFSELCVVNPDLVYVIGPAATFLKTDDGGLTWVKSDSTFLGQDLDGGIDFLGENFGVVISDDKAAHTWATYDGGQSWSYVNIASVFPLGAVSKKIYDVAIGSDSTVVIVGYNNFIGISHDGGRSYQNSGGLTAGFPYLEACQIPGGRIFAAGTDGHLFRSDDSGASWDTLQTGTGHTLSYMQCFDRDRGLFFYANSFCYKTEDGGTTLQPVLPWPSANFDALAATDEKVFVGCWGGGEMSIAARPDMEWSFPSNLFTNYTGNITSMSFAGNDFGVFSGWNGFLGLTDDGGQTWTVSPNPMSEASNKTIYCTLRQSVDNIYASGTKGYFIQSSDGGASWENRPNEINQTINDFTFLDNGRLVLVGNSGTVWGDSDTSETIRLIRDFGSMAMKCMAASPSALIIGAGDGVLFRADPAAPGELDTVYVNSSGDAINDVAIWGANSISTAVGNNGLIVLSLDGGRTWEEEESPLPGINLKQVAEAGGMLWVAGDAGTILRKGLFTFDDGIDDRTLVSGFQLSGNYPNPFNPQTTISFRLDTDSQVTLAVYNSLGQRVALLMQDRVMPAGAYTRLWNGHGDHGEQLASGLYFCRMTTPSAVKSIKMLLLK